MPFNFRFTLHKLSVFCRVVDAGGMGLAAEQLCVAQPVVSAHIKALEERLGTKLFERSGRQLTLTPAGEAIYRWARETLSRASELERELGGLSDGTAGLATIAASMSLGSYLLPSILSAFHWDHPNAAVALSVTDTEQALAATATGAADFAVVLADEPPDSGIFDVEIVGREDLVLVAAPDYALAGDLITVEEAKRLRYIVAPRQNVDDSRRLPYSASPHDHPRRAGQLIHAQLQRAGLDDVEIVMELGHPEAMKRAVRQGVGVSMLLRSSVGDEIEAGTLREIVIDTIQLSLLLHLVRRQRKRLSPMQESLYEFVREEARRMLGPSAVGSRLRTVNVSGG